MKRHDADDPRGEDDGAARRALHGAGDGKPPRDADRGEDHGPLGTVEDRVGIGLLHLIVTRAHDLVVAHA